MLEWKSAFLRRAEEIIFRTTQGEKQGCPLSRFLFIIVFEIVLRYVTAHSITCLAYVDDISSPAARILNQYIANKVQHILSIIGGQTNVIKGDYLPLIVPPPSPALAKHLCAPHDTYSRYRPLRMDKCASSLGTIVIITSDPSFFPRILPHAPRSCTATFTTALCRLHYHTRKPKCTTRGTTLPPHTSTPPHTPIQRHGNAPPSLPPRMHAAHCRRNHQATGPDFEICPGKPGLPPPYCP